MFVSQKIGRDLKLREAKPPIVNQQYLVYKFECDLRDAGYVGGIRSFHCRFAYESFRLLSVRLRLESIRLRLESIRLRPICQFAYVLNSVLLLF